MSGAATKATQGASVGCETSILLVRMRRFFLTSDTIDILCLVYANLFI